MPAPDYEKVAPEPHMLRVLNYRPETGDHECRFDDPRSTVLGTVYIDLMTDGLREHDPRSLVGKLVEVAYSAPWSYMAFEAKLVNDGGRL